MGEQAWTNGLGSCLMLTHRLWKMRLLVLLMASCLVATTTADLTVIQEDEWRQLLKGEWMVEFAAPWCQPAGRYNQPGRSLPAGARTWRWEWVRLTSLQALACLAGSWSPPSPQSSTSRTGCSDSTAARETKTASSALWRRRNGREWNRSLSGRVPTQCKCPLSLTSSSSPWFSETSTLS